MNSLYFYYAILRFIIQMKIKMIILHEYNCVILSLINRYSVLFINSRTPDVSTVAYLDSIYALYTLV